MIIALVSITSVLRCIFLENMGEKVKNGKESVFCSHWLIFFSFLQVQTEDNKFKCFIAFSFQSRSISPVSMIELVLTCVGEQDLASPQLLLAEL